MLGLTASTQFVSTGILHAIQDNSSQIVSTSQAVEVEDVSFSISKPKYGLTESNVLSADSQATDATLIAANTTAPKQEAKPAASLSRGGTGLPQTQAVSSSEPAEKKEATYSEGIQLLDWWKSGHNVFSIGTSAEVTDLYTGKTFMVKRTMGTNHADTEALTKEDTAIIKSIWGGFSWDRRPVILTISGKRYAASMSAMPHAGLDSTPAYSVVDNRSEGYGTGENLDVIKGNGMDGHFDIHFLNSTRHKDGQEDPQHQTAVLKAAGK
jgi:hypothetical protein